MEPDTKLGKCPLECAQKKIDIDRSCYLNFGEVCVIMAAEIQTRNHLVVPLSKKWKASPIILTF